MRGTVNWALRNADGILGVSPFVAQSAIDAGYPPNKVFHVVNALDLSASKWDPAIDGRPARQSLGVAPDEPLIGITARLFPWKGHRFLVDALAIVKQQIPNGCDSHL
jgi:glycosyltransferase involved in cell wall biosynthesis